MTSPPSKKAGLSSPGGEARDEAEHIAECVWESVGAGASGLRSAEPARWKLSLSDRARWRATHRTVRCVVSAAHA